MPPPEQSTTIERSPAIDSAVCAPINLAELQRRCMGRLEFAQRLLDSFEDRFPVEVLEILKSLNTQDLPSLARLTHRLKGTAANISAPILSQILQRIEEAVHHGNLAEAARLVAQLQVEWGRFLAYRATTARQPQSSQES